jgi:sugar (glycoside-pentoside-hexuronide) transporter
MSTLWTDSIQARIGDTDKDRRKLKEASLMNRQPEPDGAGRVFPKWRYFTFAASDMGYALVYYWIASFLTFFYTDIFGVNVVAVSVMMLITRIYDAANDPIIGGLLDNSKSKMGRYRPWIIVGGIGMVVSTIFLFWAHPNWNNTGKVVYMYATYILCTTAMTVFYMAYGALGGTISSDSMVRIRATGMRFAFSGVGNLAVGYFVPVLLVAFATTNISRGYLIGVIISGVIAVPLMLITGFGTREVIYPPKDAKASFKVQFKALVTNKPMLVIMGAFLLQGTSITFRMTAATYYFNYVAKNMNYFSLYNLLVAGANIAGSLTAMYLYGLIRDKAKALGMILVVTILALIGMYFTPAPNASFFILAALSGYSNGAIPSLTYSMLAEAVDYTHYKDGLRIDGFMAAAASFAFKCGMAFAGSMAGFLLNATGYVANARQTAGALQGISFMMTLIPALLLTVMCLLMPGYPLKEKKHNEIMMILRERGHL